MSEPEFAGRRRRKAVSRELRWVKGISRFDHQTVIVGVVSGEVQPAREPCLSGEIEPAGSSDVGIEKISKATGRDWKSKVAEVVGGGAERKSDNVVEAAGKVFGCQADMVVEQFLFDACGPSLAGFRFQRRVAKVAKVVAEDLVEARLFDALAVENAEHRVAAHALPIKKNERGSGAGNDARAEIGVGFGAASEIQRNARMRAIAKVQIAGLIVAARMRDAVDGV